MAFGPGVGNDFGDFMYVADFGTGAISKVDTAGVVTPFATTTAPGNCLFDPLGNYGTDLFVAESAFAGPIATYDSAGASTFFSSADATYMKFGPGGAWGTDLYVTNYGASPGISTVDVLGVATPFVTGFSTPEGFDWGSGPGFNDDMFATDVNTGQIWRVQSDTTMTPFANFNSAADVAFCNGALYAVSSTGD